MKINKSDSWNADDYQKNSSAQSKWAHELISKLSLRGNESLLDIGCGDGKITDEIAKQIANGKVVGIDYSSDMIQLATNHFKRPNLSFYVMNAMEICLDKKFDVAFSNAALHWIKDHRAVLRTLKKHLNPDSRILFQMGGFGNAQDIVDVVESVMDDDIWSGYFKGFEFPYHFYKVEDYETWLPQTGFQSKRIELISKDMVHSDRNGLKGWLRTTWFPYTDPLPETKRDAFLEQVLDKYLQLNSPDSHGQTHVKMVRLEVEAVVT